MCIRLKWLYATYLSYGQASKGHSELAIGSSCQYEEKRVIWKRSQSLVTANVTEKDLEVEFVKTHTDGYGKALVHWAHLSPVHLFWRVLSARVNRLSDGRELTVSAGRLARSLCPLKPIFLRTSVFRSTYVKKNGLVDTGLLDVSLHGSM